MNKKNLRAAGWALCLAMAVAGIGAAVGASFAQSNDAAIAAFADTDTVDGSASCSDIYGSGWFRSGVGGAYGDGSVKMDTGGDYFRKTDIFSGDVSAKMVSLSVTINGKINGTVGANSYRVDAIDSKGASLGSAVLTGASYYTGTYGDQTFVISSTIEGCTGIKVTYATKDSGNWGIKSVSWTATYDVAVPATGVAITRGSTSSLYPAPIEGKTVTVEKGTGSISEDLVATVTPSEAGDKTVTWSVGGDNPDYVDWTAATKGDTNLLFTFDVNNPGSFTITASADGGTDVTDVVTYCIVDPTAAKLTSVTVTGTPTKAIQTVGNAFDPAGLTFTAHYDDESSKEIEGASINWNPLVSDSKPSGSYSEGGVFVDVVVNNVQVVNKVVSVSSTDVIDRAFTGVAESTSYASWAGKKAHDAVYAGQSAGDKNTVQIRSKNSDSGVITTTSGGKALSIAFTWNAATAPERTVDIYGKNTAYASPTELYSESTQGTLIGSVAYGDTKPFDLGAEYAFIAFRSTDGAVYLTDITIEWGTASEAADVAAVNDYIGEKMHLENQDDESGKCKSEGWYSAAKTAFGSLTDAQKNIILTSASEYKVIDAKSWKYSDIKARLSAWATANGESFDPNTGAFSKNTAKNVFFEENGKTGAIVSLAAVAGIGLIATGVLFLLRKKKEEK